MDVLKNREIEELKFKEGCDSFKDTDKNIEFLSFKVNCPISQS